MKYEQQCSKWRLAVVKSCCMNTEYKCLVCRYRYKKMGKISVLISTFIMYECYLNAYPRTSTTTNYEYNHFLLHLNFEIFLGFPLSYVVSWRGALLNETKKTQMHIAGEGSK